MQPQSKGQIVKFHTPLAGENVEQQYIVLDLYTSDNIIKAKIQALNTGLPFPPINIVKAEDIEIAPVSTVDLIGHIAFVVKEDGSKILGKVFAVEDSKVIPRFDIKDATIETDVIVSITDKEGTIHHGILVVS